MLPTILKLFSVSFRVLVLTRVSFHSFDLPQLSKTSSNETAPIKVQGSEVAFQSSRLCVTRVVTKDLRHNRTKIYFPRQNPECTPYTAGFLERQVGTEI